MVALLALLVTAAGVAIVAAGLVWLGRRVRRRGIGGEAMGPWRSRRRPAAKMRSLDLGRGLGWLARRS